MANDGRRLVTALVVVALFLVGGVAAGSGNGGPGAPPPVPNKTPVQVSPALFHPDLQVTLKLDTSVGGQVTMNGEVCNRGNRDWSVPPAAHVDSEYMVYTTHPPHTYAQEANLVFPGHQGVGTHLAVNQCVEHKVVLQIPNMSRWLKPAILLKLAPDERLAQKQFVFRLNRDYPNGSNFPMSEDGNPANNSVVIELQYAEKTQ